MQGMINERDQSASWLTLAWITLRIDCRMRLWTLCSQRLSEALVVFIVVDFVKSKCC